MAIKSDKMLVFSPEYTRKSCLAPQFMTDINDLCCRDYGKSFFPFPMPCLDLDAYETSFHKEHKDYTMDAAMGIADYERNKESRQRHLLLELRFAYESVRHLNIREMKRKVTHSRDLLFPEPTDPQACFLFIDSVAPQAKNYFYRISLQDKEVEPWKAMTPNDFMHFVYDRSRLPYQPENDLSAISSDLNNAFLKGGLPSVDRKIDYWKSRMDDYKLRYMSAESNAIAGVLYSFLTELPPYKDDSFEKEYMTVLIDDIRLYLGKTEE